MRKPPKGKAGTPSGCTFKLVQAVADHSIAAFEPNLGLVNTVVVGRLPHIPQTI
jgi:hypothetical protein